ncbi:hypothetical protein [Nitrosovibrio sp. Nv4]|uniref:hypothetical protein n=1 Tax=Nitrosovibrio sp. Nv4 TaxID=1945880 RepID=UPI000BCE5E3D|nr:hypothetical protein [Nitrosovibrio sp. Nv4]SOD41342.1 hypothetical protein SAMN06298226_1637 [Nitrosovibrio sp. Nv4]
MKNTALLIALIVASSASAYDYNYPDDSTRYQQEADRNEAEFRQREQSRRLNRVESDLRYQQQLDQIERNHRDIYGNSINPVKPY